MVAYEPEVIVLGGGVSHALTPDLVRLRGRLHEIAPAAEADLARVPQPDALAGCDLPAPAGRARADGAACAALTCERSPGRPPGIPPDPAG
ncbi:hypothetical protein V2I01_26585 [Micromonospora sp. BRA006-A]|nr:hypothetical protein [Micromonospora sp. BRA006-A]